MDTLQDSLRWLDQMVQKLTQEMDFVRYLINNEKSLFVLDESTDQCMIVRPAGVHAIYSAQPFTHNFPVCHFEVLSSMKPFNCADDKFMVETLTSSEQQRIRALKKEEYFKFIGKFIRPELKIYLE